MEEIAKSVAKEAAKITAEEGTAPDAEEARKAAEELNKPSGSTSASLTIDVQMEEAGNNEPTTINRPSMSEVQPSIILPEPTIQQQELGAPSLSGIGVFPLKMP